MDQGSTRKRCAVHNFAPTVTKFCVMWEGQALPHDTKFGNCRCKIVGRRVIFIWSLIHGSSGSGLIKAEPGGNTSTTSQVSVTIWCSKSKFDKIWDPFQILGKVTPSMIWPLSLKLCVFEYQYQRRTTPQHMDHWPLIYEDLVFLYSWNGSKRQFIWLRTESLNSSWSQYQHKCQVWPDQIYYFHYPYNQCCWLYIKEPAIHMS